MPAFLMQFVNSIKAIWAKMSVIQRVAVLGGLVLVGSAAIGLSIWASRPDFKVLYSNLSAEDASVVIKSLQSDKVMRWLKTGATSWPSWPAWPSRPVPAGFCRPSTRTCCNIWCSARCSCSKTVLP